MANLMDLLQGQLTDSVIDQLSNQLGGADRQQTKTAADSALSTLMAALSKNAAQPEGASALANALDRDHDGSILDDLTGILGQMGQTQQQPQSSPMNSALNGAGILKHVLGGKQSNVIEMISKMSGLNSGSAGSLLTMLAPMVMGALGKQKRQQNLDQDGLSDLLRNSVNSPTAQTKEMGLIGKLLDQDGDGSIMDDIAGLGMKALGNLFKK